MAPDHGAGEASAQPDADHADHNSACDRGGRGGAETNRADSSSGNTALFC